MKIQPSEDTSGYEIVSKDEVDKLYVGSLEDMRNLRDEIEIFLEAESQKIMLKNFDNWMFGLDGDREAERFWSCRPKLASPSIELLK